MDPKPNQLVAVTGATGFIGRAICRQLAARGMRVRALVRGARKAAIPELRDAKIVPGDLADPNSLQRLVSGADAVIHCAGSVRGATQAQFDRVNVEGTRKLLQAVTAGEPRPRLLFISSLAAREPQLSFYAASKRRAERLLEQAGDDIAWTILRPPPVYGPGDREMLPLFRLMARGIALTPGLPSARFSMLFVDDLSAAIIAWLRNEHVAKGIFSVEDGYAGGYDWHDISEVVGELCQRKVRVVQAAAWLLDLPAWVNSRIAAILGTAPMLTPEKLRELRHEDWVCDGAEFCRAVGWSPSVQLLEGLRATPGWPGYRPGGHAT